MLTKEQKMILEDRIYKIIKKRLNEKKGGNDETETSVSGKKEETILNWVNDDTVNQAQIAYKMYGAKSEGEKANARSLFYKKLHGEPNDNGVPYHFTEVELNTIESLLKNSSN